MIKREKLTYEERILWFMRHFFESGMEYGILLDTMKDTDLNNVELYGEFIKIPEYKDEI